MAMTRQALEVNDTRVVMRMALELSDGKWRVSIGDARRSPSQHAVSAGDAPALLEVVQKAKKRCGLGAEAAVVSCYEAGRDGFWLHRWLVEHGVHNLVVDSSSIEVNRRQRRAKTDRLDAGKLYDMLGASENPGVRTAADNQTVRTVFVIGPDKKIKAMLIYPMSCGRNFDEVLRLLDSVQLAAEHTIATPVNWKPGEDVIIPTSISDEDAKKKFPKGFKTHKPYLRTTPQPNK